MHMVIGDRDDARRSLVDRWLDEGAPELSNDELTSAGEK
jgi:hypothetical protein